MKRIFLFVFSGLLSTVATAAPKLILHMDFNTCQMKKEAVIQHLRAGAEYGYNAVLWEIEDKVQWDTCPECVHPDAFTKAEFKEILAEAEKLGLEPIPLFQTFGHAEYVLNCNRYGKWREQIGNATCYCVSNPAVRDFQKRWVREYLELFGDKVKDFHLGGDEAHAFGTCPVCSKRNRFELYVEHLNEIADVLRTKGVKPGIWCDMVVKDANQQETAMFPRDITIWFWDYYCGCPYKIQMPWKDKLPRLIDQGFRVIFTPTTSCCWDSPFLPRYRDHSLNVAFGANAVRENNLYGLAVSSWSLHLFPKRIQYPLWQFAAKRLRNPSAEVKDDLPEHYELLDKLTRWEWRLNELDDRVGDFSMKWARPRPKGTALGRAKYFAYDGLPKAKALHEDAAEKRKVLAEYEKVAKSDDFSKLIIQGAKLVIEHQEKLAELIETGKRPADLPEAETRAYYEVEQTEYSAATASSLLWTSL